MKRERKTKSSAIAPKTQTNAPDSMIKIRQFSTGATRDEDIGKLDYEGFFSPAVLKRYAQYMHKNRIQSNGALRDSDNWQKGIPKDQYMKSLWRHFMDVWAIHRGEIVLDPKTGLVLSIQEALCALKFNANGYLFEELKQSDNCA